MKRQLARWPLIGFILTLLMSSFAMAEDIDIFVGGDAADSNLPNVIFVLDNTSNWSRQNQQWPGGLTQGEAEVRAIRDALSGVVGKVNVGLVQFRTGTGYLDGGYVRFALQPLTAASQGTFNGVVDRIYNNINSPDEKRNAGAPFGELMGDVYSYLGGLGATQSGSGTLTALSDDLAYATDPSQFHSPLDSASLCGKTYLIFIGNPASSGPTEDSTANTTALRALYEAAGASPARLAGDPSGTALPIPTITTTTVTEAVDLGYSNACYGTKNNEISDSLTACAIAESLPGRLCEGWDNCACTASKTESCTTKDDAKLFVQSVSSTATTIMTGQINTTAGAAWNLDDWAHFLKAHGVPVTVNNNGVQTTERHSVITYTIDVYNKSPNASHSGLLYSAAQVGGGRYFAATSQAAILSAIQSTLSDILSISSTFAAVTLPLSTTNRALSENEVFIGMFRPDQQARPRWFGNLKRYQVALSGANTAELADARGRAAINPLSGFAAECAESYWTRDTGNYWENLGITPPPKSQCAGVDIWSDLPDGPFIEKGGVAQKIRESQLASRVIKTVSDNGSLTDLTAAHLGNDSTLFNYFRGTVAGAGETAAVSGGRPSIHGDVIHSRPLPINYGTGQGTVVYYGSNDGLFRAVGTSDGVERWAMIAPEHLSKIQRLYANTPIIAFPNQDQASNPEPKDYFFDGSVGQLVSYADGLVSKALIFPTMRRGGRMVYALDVTDPDAPVLLWRRGCEAGGTCSTGFGDIGQTWSTPRGVYVEGYTKNDAPAPVVIFGGGYDGCEDHTTTAASCGSAKGKAIYVVDAQDGTLLKTFSTERSVVADINTVDINADGNADYAYGVDAGGNLWRINFVGSGASALTKDGWTMDKVAYTSGANRKFMNMPALMAHNGSVYIALGSGNRERPLKSDYPYADRVQDRFYMLLDSPASGHSAIDLDSASLMNSSIDPGCAHNGIYANTESKGWYLNLPNRGEQVVNPAAIAGGDVFFNTYQPGGTKVGMCSRPHGIATGYRLSLFNGSFCGRNPTVIPGGGMPIAPTLTTVKAKCTGENCDNDKVVTICIGCDGGLKPTEIKPDVDGTRTRKYWASDIDK